MSLELSSYSSRNSRYYNRVGRGDDSDDDDDESVELNRLMDNDYDDYMHIQRRRKRKRKKRSRWSFCTNLCLFLIIGLVLGMLMISKLSSLATTTDDRNNGFVGLFHQILNQEQSVETEQQEKQQGNKNTEPEVPQQYLPYGTGNSETHSSSSFTEYSSNSTPQVAEPETFSQTLDVTPSPTVSPNGNSENDSNDRSEDTPPKTVVKPPDESYYVDTIESDSYPRGKSDPDEFDSDDVVQKFFTNSSDSEEELISLNQTSGISSNEKEGEFNNDDIAQFNSVDQEEISSHENRTEANEESVTEIEDHSAGLVSYLTKNETVEIKNIIVLGERNSGVEWFFENLKSIIPGDSSITISNNFTREGYWFQSEDLNSLKEPTLIVALFVNPYIWIDQMRKNPIHMPSHNNLTWIEFVSKKWTYENTEEDKENESTKGRPSWDLESFETGPFNERICQLNFRYNEVSSCLAAPSETNNEGKTSSVDNVNDLPIYELREDFVYDTDGNESREARPYDTILELRFEKIMNWLSLSSWENVERVFPIHYETLTEEDGLLSVLNSIESEINIPFVKDIGDTKKIVGPKFWEEKMDDGNSLLKEKDFTSWLAEMVNWEVEFLIGYEKGDMYYKEEDSMSKEAETPVKSNSTVKDNNVTETIDNNYADDIADYEYIVESSGEKLEPVKVDYYPEPEGLTYDEDDVVAVSEEEDEKEQESDEHNVDEIETEPTPDEELKESDKDSENFDEDDIAVELNGDNTQADEKRESIDEYEKAINDSLRVQDNDNNDYEIVDDDDVSKFFLENDDESSSSSSNIDVEYVRKQSHPSLFIPTSHPPTFKIVDEHAYKKKFGG